jgi:hypothetical protein
MRQHKIRKTLRRKKGGAWLDPTSWAIFQKKPEQAVQDAPKAVEQAVGDVVQPLGASPEPTGVPGGMPASAPAAALGGRRRKHKTRKTRKHKTRR